MTTITNGYPPPPSGNTSEQSRPTSETTRLATDGGSLKQKRILIYDDFNATFPKNQDVIGTVRQTFAAWEFTNGYKIIEVYEDLDNTRPKEIQGLANQ